MPFFHCSLFYLLIKKNVVTNIITLNNAPIPIFTHSFFLMLYHRKRIAGMTAKIYIL